MGNSESTIKFTTTKSFTVARIQFSDDFETPIIKRLKKAQSKKYHPLLDQLPTPDPHQINDFLHHRPEIKLKTSLSKTNEIDQGKLPSPRVEIRSQLEEFMPRYSGYFFDEINKGLDNYPDTIPKKKSKDYSFNLLGTDPEEKEYILLVLRVQYLKKKRTRIHLDSRISIFHFEITT